MVLPIDSRTGIPMTALHTEKALEDEICHDLAAARWLHDAGDAARYDRALALFRAGRHAEARVAFDAVLKEPLAELYVDDVLEYRVRIAAALGDAAALEAAARAFVRDCSWVSKARIAAVRKLWTQGKDAAAALPPVPPPVPEAPPGGDDDD